MKKKEFLSVHYEELKLANLAKDILSKDFDVTVWDDRLLSVRTMGWSIFGLHFLRIFVV